MSQMHVSRLRAHALGYLRSRLLDLQEHPVASGGRVFATRSGHGRERAVPDLAHDLA